MKDLTNYNKICVTEGCSNHPDIYNTRCDMCFAWYRQESKVKNEHYNAKMGIKFKTLDEDTIKISGIDYNDSPDFCDTYISKAQWYDGTELTDDELGDLTDWYTANCLMHDLIHNTLY